MEYLQFIFSGPFVFLGFFALVCAVFGPLSQFRLFEIKIEKNDTEVSGGGATVNHK